MDYKVNDEFLDKVDALLDTATEVFQCSDTLDGAGVALLNLEKFERMKEQFIVLCDAMDDGFPEYGKEDVNEEDTEECADDCDSNLVAIFDDPDDVGCDNSAD